MLLSSGAEHAWMIRHPHDVLNLAGLYGIPPNLRRGVLADAPAAALAHAGTRRLTHRGAVMLLQGESPTSNPPLAKRPKTMVNDFANDFIKLV